MLNTPILFLIFNRPDSTEKVFEEIKKIKPRQLFIAADGPRINIPDESSLCEACRAIVSKMDWDCEVKRLFREQNLGCGTAVSEAITWFFEHVEQGIILEDDCLPDPSFFSFCETLLEKYKNDHRISTIGACNYQLENNTTNSYYFSIYSHIWGWATWRRTWNLYRYRITDYKKEFINQSFKTKAEREYWHGIFHKPENIARLNTWDYQLQYLNFRQNMLSIIPSVNLVKNIGFYDGTHLTENIPAYHFKIRFGSIDNIVAPSGVERDYEADLSFYKNMLSLSKPPVSNKIKQSLYSVYQRLFSK